MVDDISLDLLAELLAQCETAGEAGQAAAISNVAEALCPQSIRLRVAALVDCGAYMDAAIAMLPDGSDWRKFTPMGCSLYAASPFNAAASVRYDGHSSIDSLSLCAALLRMVSADAAKKAAAKARRAA